MSRLLIAEISQANLVHNLNVIKNLVAPAKIIAMVKCNAYGHGLKSIAKIISPHVDVLGVGCIEEALEIRKADINSPILLVQGIYEPAEIHIAIQNNLDIVFNNQDQITWLDQELAQSNSQINCWIKVNTGMGRLGFEPDDAEKVYAYLSQHKNVNQPIRIMSHFACADNTEHSLNAIQSSTFKNFINNKNSEYSLCNSAAIFNYPDNHYDFVRPGIALYGVSPILNKTGLEFNLKPVLTLKTKLMSVQTRQQNTSIGYNARYVLDKPKLIGTIACGYGDGYPLTAKDGTPVLVNGHECPLIGRVSMDMLTVDLSNSPNAKVGDDVVLWGEGLPIEKVCSYTQSIVWNMLTGLHSHRVRHIII
jgi:alanine racemase